MASDPVKVYVSQITATPVSFDGYNLQVLGDKVGPVPLSGQIKALQRQGLVFYAARDEQVAEHIRFSVATAETLTVADNGGTVVITNGSAITLTLPNNLPATFSCNIIQGGAGAILFASGSGASFGSRGNLLHSNGLSARCRVLTLSNVDGVSAAHNVSGDMTT
jgi:hypothetical protein